MARHREAIERVNVNHDYADDSQGLLRLKLGIMAAECKMVLDVGQSTRGHIDLFKPDLIGTYGGQSQ
jgi:hypothetical protein